MTASEIINIVCSNLGIAKTELAKRMGIYPSSLYRKLSKECMTFEELQKCLEVMGVSVKYELHYPDGSSDNYKINQDGLLEKIEYLEKRIEVSDKAVEFQRRSFRELRTELNSAVGYVELGTRHPAQAQAYFEKIQSVHHSMKKTISYALGEVFEDEAVVDSEKIEQLKEKRVLLVDDNQLNREILKEVLIDQGLIVDEAYNGVKALSALKEHSPDYYQFVLMDIEMPELDGYETTMKIRKMPNRIRASVPIIALTANARAEDIENASFVGMDDFLTKPIDSARLLGCLTKFL